MPFEQALTILEEHSLEQKLNDRSWPVLDVAKVIYAECGDICSRKEMWLVASVMSNRLRNPGFGCGKLSSLRDVAYQPGAFSCINDPKNSNWEKACGCALFATYHPSGNNGNGNWAFAERLSTGEFVPYSRIVYYHDKSITKPKSWDNKYYTAVKELETKHFIFYSIKETDNT